MIEIIAWILFFGFLLLFKTGPVLPNDGTQFGVMQFPAG